MFKSSQFAFYPFGHVGNHDSCRVVKNLQKNLLSRAEEEADVYSSALRFPPYNKHNFLRGSKCQGGLEYFNQMKLTEKMARNIQ